MDRRREILAALRQAGSVAVSGESLAATLGVSRAAVGKHVAALRAIGYVIEADPGAGYRLTAVPDAPVPEEVASLAKDPLWTCMSGGGRTGSTNDDAKVLARNGAAHGTVVLASEQVGGRGRLGRTWSSPPGGVYLSVVLRPDVAVADAPPIALVAALGVAWGMEALGVTVQLKWPNDVLVDDGKLAGILLEMSAEADRVDWVVIGCGINVRSPVRPAEQRPSPERGPLPGPAYAGVRLPDVSLALVAASVLDGIARAYADFADGGFSSVRPEFLSRHVLSDRTVTVSDRDGRVLAHGTVSGVDEWGRLEVETADGPVVLAAGEVTLS